MVSNTNKYLVFSSLGWGVWLRQLFSVSLPILNSIWRQHSGLELTEIPLLYLFLSDGNKVKSHYAWPQLTLTTLTLSNNSASVGQLLSSPFFFSLLDSILFIKTHSGAMLMLRYYMKM